MEERVVVQWDLHKDQRGSTFLNIINVLYVCSGNKDQSSNWDEKKLNGYILSYDWVNLKH